MKGTGYRASRTCNLAGVALLASLSYVGSAHAITITNSDLLFEPGAALVTLTNPTGSVGWTLRDISGNTVASGTASGSGGTINLNGIPAGYYSLELGALFQSTINTSVGIISNLATVPSAATNKFGTTGHPEILPSANYASLLAKGGMSFMRFDMRWEQLETTPGTYTFAPTTPAFIDYDVLISSLTTAGIKPLAVLGYYNPNYDNSERPYSAAGRAAYAAYAAAIADRYGAQLDYEIYNEYNHPSGFAMGTCGNQVVTCYLPMLQAAEAAIHTEAPTAKVTLTGMAGLSPNWLGGDTLVAPADNFISYDWLQEFLDNGGANYVDVFNIHNYTVDTSTGAYLFGTPEGDNETIVQNVKGLLASYPAASGKPLWLTETGWSTYPTIGVSESTQAAYLVRDAVLTLRQGLDRYEFYDLFDDTPNANPEGNWGMLRNPQSNPAIAPKPAFVAQAVLSRKLDGYSYSSSDSLGADMYSLVFTKSGSPDVRVMWTTKTQVTGVDVAATAAFTVTNYLGSANSVTPSSGTAVIALSSNPVYVVGSSVSGVSLFFGGSGGADLALSKSVVASSTSGSNVAANAVDAGVSTYWQSASLPATLTVDMGANYYVHTMKISLPPEWVWWRNESVAVLGSTDGINFSPISATAGYGFNNTNDYSVTVDLPLTNARYIRLSVTANNLVSAAQIGKLEIYGL